MSIAERPKLPINVVPEQIAPGTIIDDRYCVISDLQPSSHGWTIDATDLARIFGRAPHHRVKLYKVSVDHSQEHRLRVALRCDSEIQPRFRELRHLFDGLMIIADHVEGKPLPSVLRSAEAFAVAEAACELLGRLHGAGIRGIRFARNQFVLEDGKAYLNSFAHLAAPGSLQSDLDALHEFLASLSTALHDKLSPAPKSAMEYAQRFATDRHQFVWTDVLPPIAPYVTPHAVVESIFEQFVQVRQGSTREVRVTAPRGYGKTRLLNELAAELTHQGQATVVLAEAPPPERPGLSVLERIFAQVAHHCGALPAHRAHSLRAEVCEAIAGLEGVIATAVPTFAVWLGIDLSTVPPNIDIGESFTRQANVLATALRTLCSRRYPLVLLIDNAESLDVASIALLEELRRCEDSHVLIVLGYLESVKLESHAHVAHSLPSFGESQVRELIERSLPGEIDNSAALAAHLYATTHGRPLNCWAVLQDWVSDGTIARRSRGWELTRNLGTNLVQAERLFEARLASLDEDAFRMVLCFALSDIYLSRTDLANVLDWSEGRISNATRNAIKHAIVQSIEGQLSFTHGTVSELLIEQASPAIQTALHQRLGDWIERGRPQAKAALAFHRECATREGKHEELARLHLTAARKCLDVFDADRAKWFAERSKERSTSSALGLRCCLVMAEAHALCRERSDALREYQEAVSLCENETDRLVVAESSARTLVGRFGSAAALAVVLNALKRTRFRIPLAGLVLAFRVVWELLSSRFRMRQPISKELAENFAWVCARLGPVLVTSPLYMFSFLLRGYRLQHSNKTVAGPVVQAYCSAVLFAMQRRNKALAGFAQALEEADSNGDSWVRGVVLHVRAHCVQLPLGEYAEGQESLRLALRTFQQSGDMSIGALSFMFRCFYGRDYEAPEDIAAWAAAGEQAAERQHNRMAQWPCRAFMHLADARLGRADRAAIERTMAEMQQDNSVLDGDRFIALVASAEAMIIMCDVSAAARILAQAEKSKPAGPRLDCFFENHVIQMKIEIKMAESAERIRSIGASYRSKFARLERDYPRFAVWREVAEQLRDGVCLGQVRPGSLPEHKVANLRAALVAIAPVLRRT